MHLFVIGVCVPPEFEAKVRAAFLEMHGVYPQLDITTTWNVRSGHLLAAGMHSPEAAASPRHYVHRTRQEAVFFAGCPVERTGRFAAHRAEELAVNWGQLPETLEGPYVIARLDLVAGQVEVVTDFLGLEQVYMYKSAESWLISNNVALLRRLGASNAWDDLGLSLFLSMGWTGSDRTLHHDVRVIPSGQHWSWNLGDNRSVLKKRTWYSMLERVRASRQKRKLSIPDLASDLVGIIRQAHAEYGRIICPLTGGRDSRVVAALLLHAGVPARYETGGKADSLDVTIAREVAAAAGLPHTVWQVDTEALLSEWSTICRRLVTQTDGMVSLWQIQDILSHPRSVEHLSVTLSGVGSLIARGYLSEKFYLTGFTVDAVWRMLCSRIICDYNGLVRLDATEMARTHLRNIANEIKAAGFAPIDIPDVYYALDRMARLNGSNFRKAYPMGDIFAPFATRSFVDAAFRFSAHQRYTEPLHYKLLALLAPNLHSLRFVQGPWRSQIPALNLARWAIRQPLRLGAHAVGLRRRRLSPPSAFSQASWLYHSRRTVREMLLQQSPSELWRYIDRSRFEYLTSDQITLDEMASVAQGLYLATTLLVYENSW